MTCERSWLETAGLCTRFTEPRFASSLFSRTIAPSEANFVFVKVGRDADTVYEMMLSRGVIIRPSTTWRTGDYVRITIGTPEQNELRYKINRVPSSIISC